MSGQFDPYREWLSVAAVQRPLSHYQLLGLEPFEPDAARIEQAAMLQLSKIFRHESGPDKEIARQLAGELQAAADCLQNPSMKRAYDSQLRNVATDAFSLAPSKAKPLDAADDLNDLRSLLDRADEIVGVRRSQAKADSPIGQPDRRQTKTASGDAAAPPIASPTSSAGGNAALDMNEFLAAPDDSMSEIESESSVLGGESPTGPPSSPSSTSASAISAGSSRTKLATRNESGIHGKPPVAKSAGAVRPGESQAGKKSKSAGKPVPKKARVPGEASPALGMALKAAIAILGVAAAVWFGGPFLMNVISPDLSLDVDASLLQSADPEIRRQTIGLIPQSDLTPNELVALLLPVLRDDQDANVRAAAAQVLSYQPAACRDSLSDLKALHGKEKDPAARTLIKFLIDQIEKPSAGK